MDRRSFIATIGGLVATSRDAFAQKSGRALVGFLCGESEQRWVRLVAAFNRGLGEAGYFEGKNLSVEYRWAEGHDERLPALAQELARRPVDILVSTGGPNPALAAKAATATIPIVFTLGADPVKLGLVSSLGRPGGNVTGVGFSTAAVNEKRVQLLYDMVPKATVIGVLVAPDNPVSEATVKQVESATRLLGPRTFVLRARTERELESAFTDFSRARISAVFVASDGFFYDRRAQITALAARFGIPASYELREYVEAGGS
jgi:putative ABC transport system substrate-binding protein